MTTSNPLAQLIVGAIILIAILASVVTLALHGTITGTEAMGAIGSIILIGGAVFGVTTGIKTGASATAQGITVARALPPDGQ